MITIKRTEHAFAFAEFTDHYGSRCSIQESSLATEPAIWLGVQRDFDGRDATRMHLTQEMAADLLPLLQNFVLYGELMPPVEAFRREGGWINVRELQPPTEVDGVANQVIATNGSWVGQVYWNEADGWCTVEDAEPLRNVTHWQPLPPSPFELYLPGSSAG